MDKEDTGDRVWTRVRLAEWNSFLGKTIIPKSRKSGRTENSAEAVNRRRLTDGWNSDKDRKASTALNISPLKRSFLSIFSAAIFAVSSVLLKLVTHFVAP